MCQCVSCKATDRLSTAGFATWPKGEPRPIPRKLRDNVYDAHWAHCGAEFYRKPAALVGSPFPCTGTTQTDPRKAYHFPGGQIGAVKHSPCDAKVYPRRDVERPPATDSPAEYVASFVSANHLTA